MEDNLLFSTRDIVAVYPNNLGLQKTLSQFVSQMKIRRVKMLTIRPVSSLPQIRVACYDIHKLKDSMENYIKDISYKLCGDRKHNLNALLEIINDKISKGEDK